MKKKVNGLLALLLAMALLLAATSGCTPSEPDVSDESTADGEAVSDAASTEEAESQEELSSDGQENSEDTTGDVSADDAVSEEDADTNVGNGTTAPSGNKTDKTTKKTTSSTKKTTSTTRKKVDLKGYDFVIASTYIPVAGESDYDDAVLSRIAQVEKELNCTIRYEYYNDVTMFDDMSPLLMAGDKIADVISMPMHHMGRFINAQMLYNIDDIPTIDQSAACYHPLGFEYTTLESGTYGFLSDMYAWNDGPAAITYNRTLLKKMGLTDPMEYVKKNEWTWDVFKTMVSKAMKDLDNDGAYTVADQWACSTTGLEGVISFYNSSGNSMLTVKDKKFTYTMDSKDSLDALSEMKSIFAVPGGIYHPDGILSTNEKQFEDGKVVFWLGPVVKVSFQLDMEDDICCVPMPKRDKNDQYVAGLNHNCQIMGIPTTIKDPATTGTIIQYLSEVAYENNEQALRQEIFKLRVEDDASIEMMEKYIYPNSYFDPAMLVEAMSLNTYNATSVVVCNPIIENQEAYVAAELIEQYKATCEKFLKVFNKK